MTMKHKFFIKILIQTITGHVFIKWTLIKINNNLYRVFELCFFEKRTYLRQKKIRSPQYLNTLFLKGS